MTITLTILATLAYLAVGAVLASRIAINVFAVALCLLAWPVLVVLYVVLAGIALLMDIFHV